MMMMIIIIINIRNLYMGINDFKKSYQPRNNTAGEQKRDLLQTPTVVWLFNVHGFSNVSRQKYTQQNH